MSSGGKQPSDSAPSLQLLAGVSTCMAGRLRGGYRREAWTTGTSCSQLQCHLTSFCSHTGSLTGSMWASTAAWHVAVCQTKT